MQERSDTMIKCNINYHIIKNLDTLNQIVYAKKVYSFLFLLNFEYPNFTSWYNSLFKNNGLLNEEREIIICTINGNVVGVAILKSDKAEKKICTLRVLPAYQYLGIGSALMEKSFELLNNDKPLITIHISKYQSFKRLFEKYNFSLEQQMQGYYGLMRSELSYNGVLSDAVPCKNSLFEQIIFDVEKRIYGYTCSDKKVFVPNTLNPQIQLL